MPNVAGSSRYNFWKEIARGIDARSPKISAPNLHTAIQALRTAYLGHLPFPSQTRTLNYWKTEFAPLRTEVANSTAYKWPISHQQDDPDLFIPWDAAEIAMALVRMLD